MENNLLEKLIIERINSCQKDKCNLGFPKMQVHPMIKKIFMEFVDMDPNHVAYQDRLLIEQKKNSDSTLKIEQEVVEWVNMLYDAEGYDGQVTTGGTESNITAIWIARELLQKEASTAPVVIGSELTHYTVAKSCKLLGLRYLQLPVNDLFSMDPLKLKTALVRLLSEGVKTVILILTLGYTVTGSNDDFSSLSDILKSFKEIRFYTHVDAAIGGLVYPFLAEDPISLTDLGIESLSLDFHKTGFVPYGAGVIIVKSGLFNLIGTEVPYASHLQDKALLASRSGLTALFCWAVTKAVNYEKWKQIMMQCRDLRDMLLVGLSQVDDVEIVCNIYTSLGACVNFGILKASPLFSLLRKDYSLYGSYMFKIPGQRRVVECHRINVNNDVNTELILEFISRVKECADSVRERSRVNI